MRTHLHLTAALFVVAGLIFAAAALISPSIFAAAAASADASGEDGAVAAALLHLTGRTVTIGGALLAGPSLICGWGVLRHRRWARWLAILLASIALVYVPIGTVVGGYVLWVMLSERFEPWFDGPESGST